MFNGLDAGMKVREVIKMIEADGWLIVATIDSINIPKSADV